MGSGPSSEERESRREQTAITREMADLVRNYQVRPEFTQWANLSNPYFNLINQGRDVASDPRFASLMNLDQLGEGAMERRRAAFSPTGMQAMAGRSGLTANYLTGLAEEQRRMSTQNAQQVFGQQYGALRNFLYDSSANYAQLDLGRFGVQAGGLNNAAQSWGNVRQADFESRRAGSFNWGSLIGLGASIGGAFATGGASAMFNRGGGRG
jgi:hypothetical protein